MKKAVGGAAVILILVPMLVILIVTGGGACDPASAQPGDDDPGKTVDPEDIPVDNVGPYQKDPQLKHAAIIMNAAADADLSERAQIIGVMAAIGESTLINVDHGDNAGPDSRGLFQQRAEAWGTYEQRMDPYMASQAFFGVSDHAEADGLVSIDGWEDMEMTLAINQVQSNADPYHYEEYEDDARDIVEALKGVPLANDAAAAPALPVAHTGLNAQQNLLAANGALAAPQAASGDGSITEDDLTLGPVKDHVVDAALVFANIFASEGLKPGDIGGYRDGDTSRDPNGHPNGLAIDLMVPLNDEGKALGQSMADYAVDNAEELNVQYVIWYQQIYNVDRPDDGWRDMEDRGSPTQNHKDHPHISFTEDASGNPEDADEAPPLPGQNPDECEEDDGGSDIPPGENEPGEWGGHENGRIPEDELQTIPWASDESLRSDAVTQLTEMNNAFRDEFGQDLGITDAYRTYEEQEHLYETKPPGMAAKPGYSNHGWALAVDFGTNINTFGTAEHEWMRENAGTYGWKHPEWARQGQENAEAWHWEFHGVE